MRCFVVLQCLFVFFTTPTAEVAAQQCRFISHDFSVRCGIARLVCPLNNDLVGQFVEFLPLVAADGQPMAEDGPAEKHQYPEQLGIGLNDFVDLFKKHGLMWSVYFVFGLWCGVVVHLRRLHRERDAGILLPNVGANLPGPLQGLHAARNRNAAQVKLSDSFGLP